MARVVVTGGAGFLGSHLCRALLDRGDNVVVIDNLVTGAVSNIEGLFGRPGFTFVEHDVSNYMWVPGPVDVVMHLASPASPVDFERIPIQILKVGALGTHNCLGLAKAKGARFFLASTSEVYGDPLVHPQPETYWGNVNPLGPRGVYDEAKRFAEAITTAYHRHHDLDVRIVRIFNSILGDEQVLYDDGHELRRESIETLAARVGTNVALSGITVPSFGAAGVMGAREAVALVGHRPGGPCYEVTTRYGRSIKVTGDHSVFVRGPDGVPTARTVTELKLGERIAVARRIVVPERDRSTISMVDVLTQEGVSEFDLHGGAGRGATLPIEIEVSDELLWVLGLWVAEGTMYEHPGSWFLGFSTGLDLLERAAKLFERDLGLHVVWSKSDQSHPPQIFVHGKALVALWRSLGFDPNRKRIPGWILGLPLHRLKWFMEGYREGDGVHSGKKLQEGKRHEFSTISEELKDDLVVALARFGICPSIGRYHSRRRAKTDDRGYPFWRLTVSNVSPWSPLDWDRGVEQRLDATATGDLVWAAVSSIEELPMPDVVYDFCVPGSENFWAGTGVMAHNTYGELMRPDDGRAVSNFVVQALQGEPLTVYGDGSQTRSFTYVADLIAGFLALLDSDVTTPVNIGNPDEYTLNELAQLVLEATGSSSTIEHRPLPVDDPTKRRPDITKARTLLGWEPRVDLRSGLQRTVAYFQERLK